MSTKDPQPTEWCRTCGRRGDDHPLRHPFTPFTPGPPPPAHTEYRDVVARLTMERDEARGECARMIEAAESLCEFDDSAYTLEAFKDGKVHAIPPDRVGGIYLALRGRMREFKKPMEVLGAARTATLLRIKAEELREQIHTNQEAARRIELILCGVISRIQWNGSGGLCGVCNKRKSEGHAPLCGVGVAARKAEGS